MTYQPQRDFIGYGRILPRFYGRTIAKLARNLVITMRKAPNTALAEGDGRSRDDPFRTSPASALSPVPPRPKHGVALRIWLGVSASGVLAKLFSERSTHSDIHVVAGHLN